MRSWDGKYLSCLDLNGIMTSDESKFGNIYIQPSSNRELQFQPMASAIPGDEETPLVADNSPPQAARTTSHTWDIHILSLAFLLVFLAFGAAQNLQSTLNTVSIFRFLLRSVWFGLRGRKSRSRSNGLGSVQCLVFQLCLNFGFRRKA